MRRRKGRYILILIGVLILILGYADLKARVFLSEFKAKAQALIKEKIGLEGNIGDIEGGIFREVILKGIELYEPSAPEGSSNQRKGPLFFSSAAIALDYRLWDIALNRFDRLNKITFISPKIYSINSENKLSVPKVIEPAWKELTVSIRDGFFYGGLSSPVISELNGNFELSETGIESQNVKAKVLDQSFSGQGRFGFPISRSAVELHGTIKGEGYILKAYLNGMLDKMFVRGSFNALEKLSLNFAGNVAAQEGAIAFKNFNFGRGFTLDGLLQPAKRDFDFNIFAKNKERNIATDATLEGVSKVGITGDFSTFPYFTLNISANHLKLLGLDLLSNYNVKGKFDYSQEDRLNSIVGEFTTSGTIINYSPMRELKGNYEIVGGKIKFNGLNYGDIVFANGFISITPPNEVDLKIRFKGAQLGGLTDLTLGKGLISGLVHGDMRFYGILAELKMDGQLELLNGNISKIKYNSAKINFKGDGTIIELVNSKVYTEGGVLDLEGKLDMKEVGTAKAFKNIQLKSGPETVVLAGVDLIKGLEGKDVVFGKDVGEQFRVNFRAYASGDLPAQRAKSDEMELEYKLGGPKSIKLKMKENEDFFGVEHKVRF